MYASQWRLQAYDSCRGLVLELPPQRGKPVDMSRRHVLQQAVLDRHQEALWTEGHLQDAVILRIGPAQLQRGYAQNRIAAWRLCGLHLSDKEATA